MISPDLEVLSQLAIEKEEENQDFRSYLNGSDPEHIDHLVVALNERYEQRIDCTACGNCCRSLMINLEEGDAKRLADHLQQDETTFVDRYVEQSGSGHMQIMNTIPCHFLSANKCTVYEARPAECREFPGLHRPGFVGRSFATFMHYGRCPIIHHVIEGLKIETGFLQNKQ